MKSGTAKLFKNIGEPCIVVSSSNIDRSDCCISYTRATEMPIHDISGICGPIRILLDDILAAVVLQLCLHESMIVSERSACCSFAVQAVAMDGTFVDTRNSNLDISAIASS